MNPRDREASVTVDALVDRAIAGDRAALEAVITAIQGDVYNLAVRMLWSPDDAADATQDILLKVVTHLATFRAESGFRTWVYRIAANHLLNVRKSRVEREELTFSAFGGQLAVGLSDTSAPRASEPDQALLEEEVKIGCTQGMLLCLDRDHRVAYILGEVFDLASDEAATVLGVSAVTYRKRLSRARERLRAFMSSHCGLVAPSAPCRCGRRVAHAVATGRVRPGALLFASSDTQPRQERTGVEPQVREMEELHRVAAIYKAHPSYTPPDRIVAEIRQTLGGRRLTLLED
jgi:RNA polymerase sigma factor (sigma-70 family)